MDLVFENTKKLKEIFPEVFSDGELNWDRLRMFLGDKIEQADEKFGLRWHGKSEAMNFAHRPTTGTLRPDPERSIDWETTRNLMIEGENLEVMKALTKSYYNRIKLIYIDPPYNTSQGNDLIYEDDYRDNISNYLLKTGQTDGTNLIVSSNVETSGRFHTKWLNMIYPRLMLAKELLRDEDGVIIVSISDAELGNLTLCMDEVFGSQNFLATVIWKSTKSVTNTAIVSVSHTYNLIYAKNRDYFKRTRKHFRLPETGEGFKNPDNDRRGPWKADPFTVEGERPNQMYPIKNPKTGKVYYPGPGKSWKNEEKVFNELLKENRIKFGSDGTAGPTRKRFLSEADSRGRVSITWWDDLEETLCWDDLDTTTNATNKLKRLFGYKAFDNPKPVSLIERFIQLGVHEPNDAIVLDFFAGSGTTGEAVWRSNISRNSKYDIRYILVQLPEPVHDKYVYDKFKVISEITIERLRLTSKMLKSAHTESNKDFGFRVFKLDSSNVRAWDLESADLESQLDAQIEPIYPDRTTQDILYELILKNGFDLCIDIESRLVSQKTVYAIGDGALFVCLEATITDQEVEPIVLGIVEWYRSYMISETGIVFRDSACVNDEVKINLSLIFNQNGIEDVSFL